MQRMASRRSVSVQSKHRQLEQRLGNRIEEGPADIVDFTTCSESPVGENSAMRGGDQRMLRRVSVGHHERSGAAIFLTPVCVKRGSENRENVGASEMGSHVPCHTYRSSTASEARTAEAVETCACGGSGLRCCAGDRDARCSKS